MKKKTKTILGGFIVVMVLFTCLIASLGDADTSQDDSVQAVVEEQNPLMEAELREALVMNGTGDTAIGEYAYIYVEKNDLTSLTQEQFKEFVDEVVRDSEYNYVTIIAEDTSEAIFFPGSMTEIAQYGIFDVDGMLEEVIGDIVIQDDGTYQYTAR